MLKVDLEARLYKLKTALLRRVIAIQNGDWHDGAHNALNKVLDILQEYRT